MRTRHTTLLLLASSVASLGSACALDEEISLEGKDLIGFYSNHIDSPTGQDQTLLLTVDGLDTSTEGGCELIAPDGVAFAGAPLTEDTGLVAVGGTLPGGWALLGGFYDPACADISFHPDATPRDDGGDGELVVESGGGRAVWSGADLLTKRRYVPLDPLTNVARGSTLRFRYEPASDVVTSLQFAALRDDATESPFDLPASIDEDDVITVTIPDNAPTGAQHLNMTVDIEIANATCEGFSSCEVRGLHFEQQALTIAP